MPVGVTLERKMLDFVAARLLEFVKQSKLRQNPAGIWGNVNTRADAEDIGTLFENSDF